MLDTPPSDRGADRDRGRRGMSRQSWPLCPLPDGRGELWRWNLATIAELPAARSGLRSRLSEVGLPETADETAGERLVLAFDELASNALRHGEVPVVATVVAGSGGGGGGRPAPPPPTARGPAGGPAPPPRGPAPPPPAPPAPGPRRAPRPRHGAASACTSWPGWPLPTAGTSTRARSTCGPACRRPCRTGSPLSPEPLWSTEPERPRTITVLGLSGSACRRLTAGRGRSHPCR